MKDHYHKIGSTIMLLQFSKKGQGVW